jgi:FtsP/CotA-like multicopper oxidase with cupredoxin domain
MTRLNVYAGPAGFYIVRGGPGDTVLDTRTGAGAVLPGPAPMEGDAFTSNNTYFEIPIAIQDRTFRTDGSLFCPDTRTFFDGITGPYLPDLGDDGMGFSPIWNPEFFGATMMVNGNTWPFLAVQQRRYRFRFLNGCDSRFLILDFAGIPGVDVWQVGNEGGFLPAPVNLTASNGNRLLLGLAERADLIVDFGKVPVGNHVLHNVGPDEPFGGGIPGVDFPLADPATTGRIMQFRVGPALAADPTTPPRFLGLPAIAATPPATLTRSLALIEEMGMGVDVDGNPVDENGDPVEGPVAAKLGTMDFGMGFGIPLGSMWEDTVTETPALGATETWEFHNTTGDAHPMHIHETVFEVVNREGLTETINAESGLATYLPDGNVMAPEPWEAGFKDTVTAYPGQITRVKATFTKAGQYVWHCHIVSHEDNEMMRPFRIGPVQPGQPRP